MQDLISDALDECKIGGNVETAQVLATLAVAQAIADLATAVADRPGVDGWHPLHIATDREGKA